MTHLTPDELLDAMEGLLAGDRQAHLSTCEACQRELADLSSALSDARQASIPEPSPLFWTHFSQRVNLAIDAEPVSNEATGWLRWQVLLPLGAMAILIVALASSFRLPEPLPAGAATTATILEPEDDSWRAVADLVGDIDIETASATGVIAPGVAEEAVLALTAEEQQELTALLRAELQRVKS